MVQQITHDPKVKGLNPAFAVIRLKNIQIMKHVFDFFPQQDSTSSDFNHNFNESKVFKNDNMNGRNFGRENFHELGWIQHQGPMLKNFLRT